MVGVGGVGTLSEVSSVYGGYYSYCAETATGLDCWGFNDQFELGSGESGPDVCAGGLVCSFAPVAAVGIGGTGSEDGVATLASTGDDGTAGSWCAGLNSGTVACWGWNYSYAGPIFRMPNYPYGPVEYYPQVEAAMGANSIVGSAASGATGSYCAIVGGGVKCWRTNQFGQLGNGTSETVSGVNADPSRPVDPLFSVSGTGGTLSGVADVTSGMYSYCARLTAGGLDCWGLNGRGDLGNGSGGPESCSGTSCSTIARPVVGVKGSGTLTGVTGVASDLESYCAVLNTGKVDCWGAGDNGGLGNGTLTPSPVPVEVLAPL